jgi:predicted DNA-binding WGR domain protein
VLKVSHRYLKHPGGTKDYDLLMIVNKETHRAILVQRWGKVGMFGQSKKSTGPEEQIRREFWSVLKQREKRGYHGYHENTDKTNHFRSLKDIEDWFSRMGLTFNEKQRAFLEDGPAPEAPQFVKPKAGEAAATEQPELWGSW